jgi:hypothetical protein
MKVYHLTLKENLKIIKKEGLKKSFGEIYFCDNLRNTKNWLRILMEDSFDDDINKWIIIKTNIPKRQLIFDKSIENILQLIYKGKRIKPNRLQIIRNN